MKVDFLKPNYQNRPEHIQHAQKPIQSVSKNVELSNIFYVPFGSLNVNSIGQKLESLSGIHCPVCGVKMLTREEFAKILERAKNIQSKEDFISILKDNEESIDKPLKFLYDLFTKIIETNPEVSLDTIFAMARTGANKNLNNILAEQVENLKLLSSTNISENDKSILNEIIKTFNNTIENGSGISKIQHKELFQDKILNLELPDKMNLFHKIRNKFLKGYSQRAVLSYSLNHNESHAYNVIENMFKRALTHSNPILDKTPANIIGNNILLCDKCSQHKEKSLFKLTKNFNEYMQKNYNKYIDDISFVIINNKIDLQPEYVINLHNRIRHLSSGKLYTNSPFLSVARYKNFVERSNVDFNLINEEGIPCACCGKETITHSKKLELFDEIVNTSNKQELVNILLREKNVIRNRYLSISEEFEKLVCENPNMSDEDIIKHLKIFISKNIKGKLVNNNKYISNVLDSQPLSINDERLIRKYIDILNRKFLDLPEGEQFEWHDYINLLNKTIYNMKYKSKDKIYSTLKNNVKNVLITEHVLYPIAPTLNKFDSPLKLLVQDILKESIATKDHVVAKSKSGEDNIKNIIVLCKSCNRHKGSIGFINWIGTDKRIQKNIENYFNVIKEKVYNGQLNHSYINYLNKLQMHLYEISHGRVDINYTP